LGIDRDAVGLVECARETAAAPELASRLPLWRSMTSIGAVFWLMTNISLCAGSGEKSIATADPPLSFGLPSAGGVTGVHGP
jgi:hypothetical protein